jgi:hypothetical protein
MPRGESRGILLDKVTDEGNGIVLTGFQFPLFSSNCQHFLDDIDEERAQFKGGVENLCLHGLAAEP